MNVDDGKYPVDNDGLRATLFPLSIAHLAGVGAIQAAIVLWILADPSWAAVPLFGFLVLCGVGPFVQRMQFFLPITTRGSRGTGAAALTFDDGPDPATTPLLLDLLAAKNLRATFFVVGERVRSHPDLVEKILSLGHEIGSHSYSHDPFLMFRGRRKLGEEIRGCQKSLERFGIRPVAFRPPVGVTNPRLWRVLLESGMYCAGFRRRGPDFGNLRVRDLSARLRKRIQPGDVVLLHDCQPWKREETGLWLEEVARLIDAIREKGIALRRLSEVIGRPVMEPLAKRPPNPVGVFFDAIAGAGYWENRSPAARAEERWFRSFEDSIRPEDRVLELGAGMGRFTPRIAAKAREVCAVDISPGSLEILRQRVGEGRLRNVRTVCADFYDLPRGDFFDAVCSFSAFEYVPDIERVLEVAVGQLKPGGRLCFTTAHRSFLRFFAQIGNALRQGLWLHARTCARVRAVLVSLGMEDVSVSDIGMKSPVSRGLVLAASSRCPVCDEAGNGKLPRSSS